MTTCSCISTKHQIKICYQRLTHCDPLKRALDVLLCHLDFRADTQDGKWMNILNLALLRDN